MPAVSKWSVLADKCFQGNWWISYIMLSLLLKWKNPTFKKEVSTQWSFQILNKIDGLKTWTRKLQVEHRDADHVNATWYNWPFSVIMRNLVHSKWRWEIACWVNRLWRGDSAESRRMPNGSRHGSRFSHHCGRGHVQTKRFVSWNGQNKHFQSY